jgi:endonuclease/exonuclease/phosphatase family metal-dependent hydrolase
MSRAAARIGARATSGGRATRGALTTSDARVMRLQGLAWLAMAASGCVSLAEEAGPWEPVQSIRGDLVPELGPTPPAIEAPSTLRVASWNVHFAEEPETLAANLLASELAAVDVLIIQETEAWPSEAGSRTQRLAETLGMTWAYAPARVEESSADGVATHGIALLSRFPLERVEIRRLPFIEQPIRARRRNAIAADVVIGEHRVRVIDVHLDVRIGAADRILQLDPALDEQPDRVIIGGDFNTNPWAWVDSAVPLTGTEAIVGMEQAIVVDDYFDELGFARALAPDVSTFRIPGLGARIDNLYARGYGFGASGVVHVDGSDHWPMWADIPLD